MPEGNAVPKMFASREPVSPDSISREIMRLWPLEADEGSVYAAWLHRPYPGADVRVLLQENASGAELTAFSGPPDKTVADSVARDLYDSFTHNNGAQ